MSEVPTICCIKGCDNEVEALGLCVNHWRRNKKYGSPVAMKSHSGQFRGLSTEDRFWRQVKIDAGCWEWKGGKDKNGYGIFKGNIGDQMFARAHRFSYVLQSGEVLNGLHVCHTCDNPSCVNPDHLFSGTCADNMRDKVMKGRSFLPKGEGNGHTILTESQVINILADPRPYSTIAADYGVATTTIGTIKQKRSWKHLADDSVKAKRIGNRGEKSYAAKITADDVRHIRSCSEAGKDLAVKYDVSRQTITDIRKNRSWSHVQ